MQRLLCPAILCFFLPVSTLASEIPNQSYLEELISRALQAKLFKERFWHLLLHYRENLTGGYASEADDPGFFLAPDGKTDPAAELRATLAQFFSDESVGRARQPGQCAFIARYHWLKEQLAFDDQQLPPQPCDQFEVWFAELNAESVTLIFPSAFMNNPASMFGHTLLRMDQRGQTEQTRILAYTINFAAQVPADVGFEYVYLGTTGGYRGYFSAVPYFLMVKEYGDIENRDIWEYRLNFSKEQIRWMLMHVWELGNAYFDYYFFKENCSYHLLSLLEVADPTLHLTDQFVFWTVPADTVRLITAQPDLVRDITFRSSRSTQIKRKRERLSKAERLLLNRIIEDESVVQSSKFSSLPIKQRAFLIDLASDYFHYKIATAKEATSTYRERNRTLLITRSRLGIPSESLSIEPFTASPEEGHRASRAGVGVGWREDQIFEEVTLRAGYHDLLDPDPGFTPDAQIELAAVSLRHYEKQNQFRLERFTLFNILSLSPIDSLFQSPSWKISSGLQTLRRKGGGFSSNGNLNGGVGAAAKTNWLDREVYFAFAELDANYSSKFDDNYRIGAGVTGGLLVNPIQRWKMLGSVSYLGYPIGDKGDEFRGSFGLRYTVAQNVSARAEFNHRKRDNEAVIKLQMFF